MSEIVRERDLKRDREGRKEREGEREKRESVSERDGPSRVRQSRRRINGAREDIERKGLYLCVFGLEGRRVVKRRGKANQP